MLRYLRTLLFGPQVCVTCQQEPQLVGELCRACHDRLTQFREAHHSESESKRVPPNPAGHEQAIRTLTGFCSRFPRLYRRGPKLITIGDRPASQDLALTPVFTDGELPLA